MITRVLAIAVVGTCVGSVASAAVISADDPVFGVGALTVDTDQGLGFLDLTNSTNRSFNDVSVQFGVGGDFAGFRYATEDEVIALINNFGFTPPAAPGVVTVGLAGDQLSGLVGLLDPSLVGGVGRTGGFTSTAVGSRRRVVRIQGFGDLSSDIADASLSLSVLDFSPAISSFLVMAAVPEPGSFALVAFGAGMVGIEWLRRRRKQTLSIH